MQLTVIQSLDDFYALNKEWNDLLNSCSASHVPFLRHEYLYTWWTNLGGGEWEHGDLFIIIGRDSDNRLQAIAPFFYSNNIEKRPALLLLGSIEISDYLDFIVCQNDMDIFFDSMLELLDGNQALSWEVLDLYNISEDSPVLPALSKAASKRG